VIIRERKGGIAAKLKSCFEFAHTHERNSLFEAEASPTSCGN
jgi:hypothetical protein